MTEQLSSLPSSRSLRLQSDKKKSSKRIGKVGLFGLLFTLIPTIAVAAVVWQLIVPEDHPNYTSEWKLTLLDVARFVRNWLADKDLLIPVEAA